MIITRDEIQRLAQTNPVIYACIQAYYAEQMSWEEAMMEAVKRLAEANKAQFDMLVDNIQNQAAPRIYAITW